MTEFGAGAMSFCGDHPTNRGASNILSDIKRLWRGEVALGAAFWGWLILGGVLVNGMTTALNLVLVTRDLPITGLVVGYAISVPYNLLAMIGVWRSAENSDGDPGVARGLRWLAVIIAAVLCVT
ncbi:hypothetical protein [Rhodovibrio salinarum]|uniref:Uncharacterized protein n=1 Tax=Rhodovibrio salinarum TaxID=1087 RepID=A0A934QLJ0_9PROT|nr:hypothetical protein [Rhodovibrio salinarum]MBK1699187.1 hypothetical protein [Rhodovibrio salinarum]